MMYVSDLTRTKETYQYIFPYDIPTTVTLLRERSLGLFEGQFKDKLMKIISIIAIFMIQIIKIFDIALFKSA